MLSDIVQPEALLDKLLDKFPESLILGQGTYIPTEEEAAATHYYRRAVRWLAGEDPRGAFDLVPEEYDELMNRFGGPSKNDERFG